MSRHSQPSVVFTPKLAGPGERDASVSKVGARSLVSLIPVSSMKKMERAEQFSDDTDQPPRQQHNAYASAQRTCRWRSCTTTSCIGLTEPMFGTEQPMPGAHSNDTELFLLLSLGPTSASPGPRMRRRSQITRCEHAFSTHAHDTYSPACCASHQLTRCYRMLRERVAATQVYLVVWPIG